MGSVNLNIKQRIYLDQLEPAIEKVHLKMGNSTF